MAELESLSAFPSFQTCDQSRQAATGNLLKKWHAHYRGVTCLVFNDDQSLLISGSEDGCVRVWSLYMIFGGANREGEKHPYEYSFHEHTLKVTDVKIGHGCNAIILSASEDRTCKVWSLSNGKLLRNIVFPSIIDAITLDPGEHVFYAGGRDGKIFIAALNAPGTSNSSYGLHIIGSLSEHSKAITCLASSADGSLLVSGSEDGMIRVWNTKSRNITRVFRHAKGPVNNVLVVRQPQHLNPGTSINTQASVLRGRGFLLPPPLQKYANSADENAYVKAFLAPQTASNKLLHDQYISVQTMENLIKELQVSNSCILSLLDL
ncbi:unnamed protein product [Fraxinus pennsylvanica]|uniref:Uncharacterized protein n=1 Tax=Fraxinus pennsylvanica TaxID=56036 RepID=A0AAD2DUA6_9LAMI|nr:unnamed protein product [Fraxinus pennsylvanica]